jgi:hypothetical protein
MPTLSQHVCFACRKVFKKPHFYAWAGGKEEGRKAPVYVCPECGAPMTYMGYKFRAPVSSAIRDWKKIEIGVRTGAAWQIPTKRKEKPTPKISPALKKILGVSTS